MGKRWGHCCLLSCGEVSEVAQTRRGWRRGACIARCRVLPRLAGQERHKLLAGSDEEPLQCLERLRFPRCEMLGKVCQGAMEMYVSRVLHRLVDCPHTCHQQ